VLVVVGLLGRAGTGRTGHQVEWPQKRPSWVVQ